MADYKPGLHIVSTFTCAASALTDSHACRSAFHDIIHQLGLVNVGEVYHSFPGGGFTGVVCLTESHVSIHTWPEFGVATFDVFLSNFEQDNTEKVRRFFDSTIQAFQATIISKQEITR
jgi:S-adenosylmethionine decarboxylase